MKQNLNMLVTLLVAASTYMLVNLSEPEINIDKKFYPSDWFYMQRAYPNKDIPMEKYFKAIQDKERMISKNSLLADAEWYPVGPSNIGGRITALDYDPVNNLLYAGAAAGRCL